MINFLFEAFTTLSVLINPFIEPFITLFVVIDPFGVIPIFIALTGRDTLARKQHIALKATFVSAMIFIGFAFVGDFVLDKLGISEASFRIAGGLLLLLVAIEMVVAKHSGLHSTTTDEEKEAEGKSDISVFPLAIPLIAGPGGLASITLLMREAEGNFVMQAGLIGVTLVVVALTYLCLRFSGYLSKLLGVTGMNVMTRIFGIVLTALAIQFIIDGALDVVSKAAGA